MHQGRLIFMLLSMNQVQSLYPETYQFEDSRVDLPCGYKLCKDSTVSDIMPT